MYNPMKKVSVMPNYNYVTISIGQRFQPEQKFD